MMVVTPENERQRQCAVEYWQDVQRATIFIELRMNRCLQSSLLCQVVARDKDVKVAPVARGKLEVFILYGLFSPRLCQARCIS